ncbi:hypothetical protein MPTK1_1g07440 [Marchantia polymorpha subsp. ruderalis]|uniref:Uncharacterized protein n=2 Tax=Marchantia polymorpha TaxID=3197 RepID=A0AAF6AMK2_MARPO|nr:hypothetical protein MARPO_0043s0137 [Marchantia polymorpha]BBM97672.1 hypothetical protein Mp_1g07440 [Marchantia polymorpha subsp. ruderalis]|eukprot:PTQ39915.1 hypothetical protein MARPO_0043s0137 [Marchantia polymorpha]
MRMVHGQKKEGHTPSLNFRHTSVSARKILRINLKSWHQGAVSTPTSTNSNGRRIRDCVCSTVASAPSS